MRQKTLLLAALGALAITTPSVAETIYKPPGDSAHIQFAQWGTGNMGSQPLTDLQGKRYMVWASTAGIANVGAGFYVPCCRDPLSYTGLVKDANENVIPQDTATSPHDRQWFYDKHPDWLMYKANKVSPATGGGDNLFQIDFTNPAVRQYMTSYALGICTYSGCEDDIPPAILNSKGAKSGATDYAYVSLDNVAPFNAAETVGYYKDAKKGCPGGPPACGGTWTQKYAPNDNSQYALDLLAYLNVMKSQLHSYNIGLWTNNKVWQYDITNSIKLALVGDASLRESPYAHGCVEGTQNVTDYNDNDNGHWAALLQVAANTYNKQVVAHFNYLCGRSANEAQPAEIAWMTANYYLTRDPYTFFEAENFSSIGTQDDKRYKEYNAFYNVYLGQPTQPVPDYAAPNGNGGCWERRYTFGKVVVWPYTTGSCTYTVPPGNWSNQFGTQINSGSSAITRTLVPDTSGGRTRANAIVLKQGS